MLRSRVVFKVCHQTVLVPRYSRSFHSIGRVLESSSSSKLENVDREKRRVRDINAAIPEFSPEDVEGSSSALPFSLLKNTETYGMLVRSEKEPFLAKDNDKVKVIDRENFIQGNYFSEASRDDELQQRYLLSTLEGKFIKSQIQLPDRISNAITNHIIRTHPMINTLRKTAARMFIQMNEDGLHKPPRTKYEVDAHVATIFLQNYASAYQVLSELKSKVEAESGTFSPRKILDVGYGPATGMVALNELMGDEFKPEVKHAFITGSSKGIVDMKSRAKIILNRQLNEVALEKLSPEQQHELTVEEQQKKDDRELTTQTKKKYRDELDEGDFVGPVDVHRIKIRTKLIDAISSNRKYDLIIVTQQLLKDSTSFPFGIDDAIEEYLSVLEPGGHLVIIERGNPLGFEIIARARQIMIRPENYSPYEYGKIPRPWIRGSSIKPQKQYEPTEEDLKLKATLDQKFGDVKDEDLDFGKELNENFDIAEVPKEGQPAPQIKSDYYLKVVAPYPNHLKCPLQMGNPRYYGFPKGSNLNWLQFSASVARPAYTLDFKKGSFLSGKWASPSQGRAEKGEVKAGSGRPNGKNYEHVNFNYLVMERSKNDPKTVADIESKRAQVNEITAEIERAEQARDFKLKHELINKDLDRYVKESSEQHSEHWARIIQAPMKRKGHVIFYVLTAEGNIEKWIVPKSLGKEIYHDARKALKGDKWANGFKTKTVLFSNTQRNHRTQHDMYYETFKAYEIEQKKTAKKNKREAKKLEKRENQLKQMEDLAEFNTTAGNIKSLDNDNLSEEELLEKRLLRQLLPQIEEFEAKLRKQ